MNVLAKAALIAGLLATIMPAVAQLQPTHPPAYGPSSANPSPTYAPAQNTRPPNLVIVHRQPSTGAAQPMKPKAAAQLQVTHNAAAFMAPSQIAAELGSLTGKTFYAGNPIRLGIGQGTSSATTPYFTAAISAQAAGMVGSEAVDSNQPIPATFYGNGAALNLNIEFGSQASSLVVDCSAASANGMVIDVYDGSSLIVALQVAPSGHTPFVLERAQSNYYFVSISSPTSSPWTFYDGCQFTPIK